MADYAYQPLEDSFFGKLIGEVLGVQGISKQEIRDSIYSNLADLQIAAHFVGTPKTEKRIIMNILPEKIRKWIFDGNFQSVKDEFQLLAFGDGRNLKPKIDVALEILEWIFTGFENDELVLELIRILTGHKFAIEKDFIAKLKPSYENAFLETK
ncbi:MAG: hypothetical protein IT569_06100 [Leptospiraceae bacterium]|nr:hypothetical protein [Leptospiraceae bacterium]